MIYQDSFWLTQYNDGIARKAFNPNHIGVLYFLIVLGAGGALSHVSLLIICNIYTYIYIYIYWIETLGICHD